MPKSTQVGLNILSVGVFGAIPVFNYGSEAIDVPKELNIEPGFYTKKISDSLNTRKKRMIRRSSKKKLDKNIEDEGTSYEAGGF